MDIGDVMENRKGYIVICKECNLFVKPSLANGVRTLHIVNQMNECMPRLYIYIKSLCLE